MIRNVHERRLDVPAERVGGLIDGLSSDDDLLWPRDRWPAMRLDGPLAAGARGGHGPIRYSVASYQPGRGVTFTFAPGLGLVGEHRVEVERQGDSTILRHVLGGSDRGRHAHWNGRWPSGGFTTPWSKTYWTAPRGCHRSVWGSG